MMNFNIFMVILLTVFLSGCYSKEPEIITLTEVKEVYIPIKPPRPKIKCDFTGTGNEPIAKALDCIIIQKRIIEKLTQEDKK